MAGLKSSASINDNCYRYSYGDKGRVILKENMFSLCFMIENIKELFSLEPNYFDRSFETLKKKPDALKELTSIQECRFP